MSNRQLIHKPVYPQTLEKSQLSWSALTFKSPGRVHSPCCFLNISPFTISPEFAIWLPLPCKWHAKMEKHICVDRWPFRFWWSYMQELVFLWGSLAPIGCHFISVLQYVVLSDSETNNFCSCLWNSVNMCWTYQLVVLNYFSGVSMTINMWIDICVCARFLCLASFDARRAFLKTGQEGE